jgi:hypothetical protein|tara:strand:+ start:8493 stop:8786 length:294 start_codon:yes stop_codon:yes gene_type:complete
MKFLDKPFDDQMLYVVDGELLNHLVKLLSSLELIDEGFNKSKVLNYLVKSIIQCSNYPTGEVKDDVDYIEFENMLYNMGIRLPNDEDPNNQYPEDDK